MQTALELPEGGRSARLTPAELAQLDHPTPYLLIDLDAVEGAYRAITSALPEFVIHYATKCNPDPRILARLHAAGSGFEIASYPELHTLTGLGVHAEQVIFSSPVKPWTQIREAAQAGVWRFAFDKHHRARQARRPRPRCRRLCPPGHRRPRQHGAQRRQIRRGRRPSGRTHALRQFPRPPTLRDRLPRRLADDPATRLGGRDPPRRRRSCARSRRTGSPCGCSISAAGSRPATPTRSRTWPTMAPASARPSLTTWPTRSSSAPNQAVRWSPKPACWSPPSSAPPNAAADPGSIWTWAPSTA
jgi:hypothetical protein